MPQLKSAMEQLEQLIRDKMTFVEAQLARAQADITPEQHAELKAIAARGAARKALHFATDEDGATTSGVDPYSNLFDLGDDPLAYYWDRMALAQALLP